MSHDSRRKFSLKRFVLQMPARHQIQGQTAAFGKDANTCQRKLHSHGRSQEARGHVSFEFQRLRHQVQVSEFGG